MLAEVYGLSQSIFSTFLLSKDSLLSLILLSCFYALFINYFTTFLFILIFYHVLIIFICKKLGFKFYKLRF